MKMRRLKLVAFVMTLAMVISTASAFACTGAYVGKDVSEDGTTIIARSEDQGTGAASCNQGGSLLCGRGRGPEGFQGTAS